MAVSKNNRSSISKRTRSEVLRRDGYRCRYCGATPPRVILEIDHVIPVHLGGTNARWNLTAACQDCNQGKGATVPADEIVAAVRQDEAWHKYAADQVTMPCAICSRPVDTSDWDDLSSIECEVCSNAIVAAYEAGLGHRR